MNKQPLLLKICQIFTVSLLVLLAGSACSPSQVNPPGPTALVTQVVIRVVTQEVSQEVTRIVEVPVTVTPGPRQAPTSTPDSGMSGSSVLPQATLPDHTDCLYGPAGFYQYKTSFPAGQQVEVVGRSDDSEWIAIEEVGGWNSCWIQATQADLQNTRVADLPVATILLPRSEYEFGSPTPIVRREGDEVVLSWEAVYMSADEIQGYLIDAYVCQNGQHIHLPVFLSETFEENVGTITTKITDEAGCTEPSTAHIVSVGKRGFAEWEKIFWPAR